MLQLITVIQNTYRNFATAPQRRPYRSYFLQKI